MDDDKIFDEVREVDLKKTMENLIKTALTHLKV